MGASSSIPGSPLTEDEYRDFFASRKPEWKMRVICQIRRDKGCHDLRIMESDQFENHGSIPDGPVCADLPQTPSFENFCLFAQYRCSNQQYYTKRILCPQQSLTIESNVPTERSHPLTLEALKQQHKTGNEMLQQIKAPSQDNIKFLIESSTPPHETDIHANVAAILKFAFSVSGEKPVPKEHTSTPHGDLQSVHASKAHVYSKAQHVTTHAKTSFSNERKFETTEEHIGHPVQHLHPAFLHENPLEVKNKPTPIDRKHQQNFQEVIPENKGSLFDLEKDEALVILCSALLRDSCISSAVSKAWKQMEEKTLGYGDLVCDNLGRHHEDLCSECAFCSLKTEQCKWISHLHRVPCGRGAFTTYINPEILNQLQAKSTMVAPLQNRIQFNQKLQENLQLQDWCGVLAYNGCDDPRVALWLQTEYYQFQRGNFPDQICDSTRLLHPNYCAFKSYECLQYSENRKKVWRRGCRINVTYRVLSKEEGEQEVRLWSQRFFNTVQG